MTFGAPVMFMFPFLEKSETMVVPILEVVLWCHLQNSKKDQKNQDETKRYYSENYLVENWNSYCPVWGGEIINPKARLLLSVHFNRAGHIRA